MLIDEIAIYHVRLPLAESWQSATANENFIDTILLRLRAEGQHVWAEATPHATPVYTPEWAPGVFLILQKLLSPKLLGQNLNSPADLWELLRPIQGNHYAKACLDLAIWSMFAKLQGVPLYRALGGKQSHVPLGMAFGKSENIETLLAKIQGAVDAGYARVKLKFARGWELEMLSAVRKRFPDLMLSIDCNGAYSFADFELMQELDEFDLSMIEQPFAAEDFTGMYKLAKTLQTPICIDETVTSLAAVQFAIENSCCQWVHIKLGRVGGLTPALAIHDFCAKAGVPCCLGSDLESGIGGHYALAFAAKSNIKHPAGIFTANVLYDQELCVPPLVPSQAANGFLQLTNEEVPGVNCSPSNELLSKYCLQSAILKAPSRHSP